jgi:hypothetical protein
MKVLKSNLMNAGRWPTLTQWQNKTLYISKESDSIRVDYWVTTCHILYNRGKESVCAKLV